MLADQAQHRRWRGATTSSTSSDPSVLPVGRRPLVTLGREHRLDHRRRRGTCSGRSCTAPSTARTSSTGRFRHVAVGAVNATARQALGHRLLLRLIRTRAAAAERSRGTLGRPASQARSPPGVTLSRNSRNFSTSSSSSPGIRIDASSSTSSLREDRHRHPHRERDRVGGSRRDLVGLAPSGSARSWRRTSSRAARSPRSGCTCDREVLEDRSSSGRASSGGA